MHGDLLFLAASDAPRLGGCKLDERMNGSQRAFRRARFDNLSQQHEERNNAGFLVMLR